MMMHPDRLYRLACELVYPTIAFCSPFLKHIFALVLVIVIVYLPFIDALSISTVTYAVSMLHALFAFLAFKNDIGFWKKRESVRGMSARSVIGNAICSVIIA